MLLRETHRDIGPSVSMLPGRGELSSVLPLSEPSTLLGPPSKHPLDDDGSDGLAGCAAIPEDR